MPVVIRPERSFYKNTVSFNVLRRSKEWMVVSPSGFSPCSVWHAIRPLHSQDILNPATALIIPHIEDTLTRPWLHWRSTEAVKLPKQLQLAVDHRLSLHSSKFTAVAELESDALKLVTEYIDQIGKYQVYFSTRVVKKELIAHVQFVADADWQLDFPEPDFSISGSHSSGLSPRRHRNALLLLTRIPGPYDGGIDYSLERLMKPAMDLLFDTPRFCYLSEYDPRTQNLPLVIACNSEELTECLRVSMAEAARPTLLAMIRHSGAEDGTKPLPRNTYVYGMHWGHCFLNTFVYFPIRNGSEGNPSGAWEFCEALVAQQWLSIQDNYADIGSRNSLDDLLLNRWRLAVACFTIRTHIDSWDSVKLDGFPVPHDGTAGPTIQAHAKTEPLKIPSLSPLVGHSDPDSPRGVDTLNERRDLKFPSSLKDVIGRMMAHWQSPVLHVPSEWILSAELTIATKEATWEKSSLYIRNLSKLYLHAIRDSLLPLSKTDLEHNHFSRTYVGPDYIHSIHPTRSRFNWRLLHIDDLKANTEPYRYKVYDFLSMNAASWDNVNLFISHVFAGFSTYAIRWQPSVRYPVPLAISTPTYVFDFALMVQTVPPTTKPMVSRFQKMPLTVSSPGILVGVRPLDMSSDGSTVGSDELESLAQIMRPHLQVMSMHTQHPLPLPKDIPDYLSEVPILFCTYLKPGFLHIVAFKFDVGKLESTTTSSEFGSSSAYLLDSLPLGLACETQGDLMDRMRILVALFTLQRHVVRLCSGWNKRSWPQDLLDEERQWIIDETGIVTPNPSFGVPSDHGEEASWWYESAGSMDAEDTDPSSDELEVSKVKVTEWLEKLVRNSGDPRKPRSTSK